MWRHPAFGEEEEKAGEEVASEYIRNIILDVTFHQGRLNWNKMWLTGDKYYRIQ